ncbi:hypothetical protein ACWU37_21335 (plasmid) [Photobacterium damselae subsp. damselae]
MISLYNAQGKEIPKRPVMTTDMIREGVKKFIDGGIRSFNLPLEEPQELVEAVVKNFCSMDDGYSLAKRLDNDGWDVDSEFVEDMDEVIGSINAELRAAIKLWFEVYKPVPTFEIGAELFSHSCTDNKHYGYITKISEPGVYEVRMAGTPIDDPHSTRRLIQFEDAILRNCHVGDVVEPISADYTLASGAQRYESAVVVSESPFTLLSLEGDMQWKATVERKNFRVIGCMDGDKLDLVMRKRGLNHG